MSNLKQAVTQPSNGRCYLLELPRELRDLVYQFALCHDQGITVHIDTIKAKTFVYGPGQNAHKDNMTRSNPLGATCRQLQHETKNLIIKVNTSVSLYCLSFSTPSSYALNTYLGQIGAAAVARLKRIAINGRPQTDAIDKALTSWKEVLCYLTSFTSIAMAHPHIMIIIRFRRFLCSDDKTWLRDALDLKEAARGPNSVPPMVKIITQRHHIVPWFAQLQNLPDNLRFSELEAFPRHTISQGTWAPNAPFEENLLFAERLWEDGI